jgi:DNA-binding NarL/FixJ family response regulator
VDEINLLSVWITGPNIFQEALNALLASLPGFSIWNEKIEGPDVRLAIVTDHNRLRALSARINKNPATPVLLLTTNWTPETALYALKSGVSGILTTEISQGDLAAALRQATRGEIIFSPEIQHAIVLEMGGLSVSRNVPDFDILSDREQEVLRLICEGLSNKQIAQKLYLSVRTVENHLRRIYQKLGVSSRTEAAVLAIQKGWPENF